MSKHTSGPWKLCGTVIYDWDNGGIKTRPEVPLDCLWDTPAIVGANGQEVAGCSEYYIFNGVNKEEREAKIRLLRAAPDLLEACQWIVTPDHAIGSDPELIRKAREKCKAAIAKAKGE